MTASRTSTVAYREHVLDGKATSQRERILTLLRSRTVPLSRAEIAACFKGSALSGTWDGGPDIPLASVCGRVKVLLDAKPPLVKVAWETDDPRTGHVVQYLTAVRPPPKQLTFDGFMRREEANA